MDERVVMTPSSTATRDSVSLSRGKEWGRVSLNAGSKEHRRLMLPGKVHITMRDNVVWNWDKVPK